MTPTPPSFPQSWTMPQPFPPTPPTMPPPPTLPASQASVCHPTQLCSLSQPIPISPSQPRSTGTTPHRSPSNSGPIEATRVYGFDWNENWQADREQYDNQKVNGLTFPRVIRSSALTQKLDIEGCDPLALPVAALLYQQANNHWLRKLAHGRDLYLIPTGEIAAVVFATELLSQLRRRNRGIDLDRLDRVSQVRARHDGKTVDKTSNTKYAAQLLAEHIQGWLPIRSTDPDSQHEITNLRSQLAGPGQRLGDESTEVSTPPRTGQQSSSSQSAPIQRALLGPGAPSPPPSFDPGCLLIIPHMSNTWLTDNVPTGLADRTFAKWPKELQFSEVQRNVLTANIAKADTWWANQPAEAVETIQKVAVMMGIPVTLLQKNFNATNLIKVLTAAISMTSSTSPEETQAQSASILSSSSPCDDPGRVHFNTLHHVIHHFSFSRVSYCTDPYDGPVHHPRPPA